MSKAKYRVLFVRPEAVYIIDEKDGISITNDADGVVSEVANRCGDRRIIYRDTMDQWAELVHSYGIFEGFKPIEPGTPIADMIKQIGAA